LFSLDLKCHFVHGPLSFERLPAADIFS